MERVLIIGLGTFGTTVAEELAAKGVEIIAVEVNETVMQAMAGRIPNIRVIDPIDASWLDSIDCSEIDHAIICISNLEQSILMTLQLLEKGIAGIYARASNEIHRKILTSIGATNVIFPEQDAARTLANKLTAPNIHAVVRLAENQLMVDFNIPPSFVDHTLIELNMRKRFHVLVIAIRRRYPRIDSLTRETVYSERFIDAPPADMPLKDHDTLVLVGREENIRHLINSYSSHEENLS
jgi:trk system potassium uptake protein TrkA